MARVTPHALAGSDRSDVVRRGTIIATIAFLTLIDLFGSQAILPQLIATYEVEVATMGFAVNASTIGMAVSGLVVAWFSDRIDRVRGIWLSLALLSLPTCALAFAPDASTFLVLRILQGVFMASAFTLTMTYLSERCDITAAGGAMAAYITGNVASNLFGRLLAVSFVDVVGLHGQFIAFAVLNLIGAGIAYRYIGASSPITATNSAPSFSIWAGHLKRPQLRSSFIVGYFLLFVFVGAFTYVNFELVAPRIGLDPMYLGFAYIIFAPALVTTPMAGSYAAQYGARAMLWVACTVAAVGLMLTLTDSLIAVLFGMVLIGVGTFFAQAVTTGYVGRIVSENKAAANGLYLTSYYVGGIAGAAVFGGVYEAYGWQGCVSGLIAALLAASGVALFMHENEPAVSS